MSPSGDLLQSLARQMEYLLLTVTKLRADVDELRARDRRKAFDDEIAFAVIAIERTFDHTRGEYVDFCAGELFNTTDPVLKAAIETIARDSTQLVQAFRNLEGVRIGDVRLQRQGKKRRPSGALWKFVPV